jgi:hypothetical protein
MSTINARFGVNVARKNPVSATVESKALIDVVAIYCRALLSTGLERDNSIEELTDIALKLRERVNLVGVGLSNFREAEPSIPPLST